KVVVFSDQLKKLQDSGELNKQDLYKLRQNDLHTLKIFGLVFLGVVILQLVLSFLQIYFMNYASQHAMYDLRCKLFATLERMPLSFFDKNPVGRLVTRVTNDVRTLDEMLSNGLLTLLQEFLILFSILIMMLVLNWKLALVTFTVIPFIIALMIYFNRKARILYREVRKALARINSRLSEDISGVKIIQLFNQFKHKTKAFAAVNNEYYHASMKQLHLFAFFRPLINSGRRIAMAVLLWYGGGRILDNTISFGLFIAFINYIDRFFEPINQLSEKFNILQAAMSGSERIFNLMDKPVQNYREEKTCNCIFKGKIEFENVWLSYNQNNDYQLQDISFTVEPGEKIALVGHTGSGKTSIINLIGAMYPYQKGQIKIDGKKLEDYSLTDLRRNIGVVQQDVFLFSGTIKDNIVLNNKNMTTEQMKQVAHYVNVDKFIESLPQKYEEPVMERGSTLSVGQRQLIAFARVLAYDPAIFVLDEATSNIDTETELLIQDALEKVMENRTSIIVAHRLSTIQHVDRILVVHKGRIVEEGNHQELLAKEGLYYDLYRLQYT
ncbi:MAG TPA: ABC transporter permease, partial [Candidatus Cloacimonas sp.]|nr:ABC transporter permease [Candidatus Cloacimonas sp.]